jgi:glyoxylase-like metal-dependent hydrolase (beta-lactamase superfamily II)
LPELSHADIFVTTDEWQTLASPLALLDGLIKNHIDLPGLNWTRIQFKGERVGPFEASYDLMGDGSMILLPTPGHTRGSMSLLMQGPGTTRSVIQRQRRLTHGTMSGPRFDERIAAERSR